MGYLLDKTGSKKCCLESNKREQFTQKLFSDLIHDSHLKHKDYYLARVQCIDPNGMNTPIYYCYDGRQLCKYVFEMVISTEGRKIRIKNFKDPISQQDIKEVGFFRLKYDSDVPLKAEYVGNQDNFLESNCFRSKIFYSEDALDALSVNFQFNTLKKSKMVDKKRLFSIFMMVVFLIILVSTVVVIFEKDRHIFDRQKRIPQRLIFHNKG